VVEGLVGLVVRVTKSVGGRIRYVQRWCREGADSDRRVAQRAGGECVLWVVAASIDPDALGLLFGAEGLAKEEIDRGLGVWRTWCVRGVAREGAASEKIALPCL